MRHDELNALPWPWRACRGGAVKADDGSLVTTTSDRRAARALIRETEAFLQNYNKIIQHPDQSAMTAAEVAAMLNATQSHIGTFSVVGNVINCTFEIPRTVSHFVEIG